MTTDDRRRDDRQDAGAAVERIKAMSPDARAVFGTLMDDLKTDLRDKGELTQAELSAHAERLVDRLLGGDPQ